MGNNNENIEETTVTLTFDNDQTVECAVVATFPVDDNQYMALLPLEEADDVSTDEIFLYRYTPSDGDDLILEDLDDDEYERVADAFEAILDEEDFVEVLDDDEE